ncbi:Sarcosine oxidase, delta subunit, heterotetrameric [Roseovarius sp. TM1035]|jgi:sarcosine oxidase subunit delta|uniref:Sarcosine oxidase subunit delta n=1 Tax=Roseovarius mucosus TaxID=215743 RepID=A0A1V0RLG6_9RHOB|nr:MULTISPECIES: sarcosine oxidase subunit delta [Roseovarius]ARE82442.1 sarcosine oxidase subunit delta [Roseovarius mucosus]AWZ22519.1 Sarcosine oxidase delta subunit [Roseovarius sp. AK1035]EDM32250.1 Sarcosine oxidase, delta subunit, heterotetrameric [Roseovarius sp. TM1035]|tara:strand:- start:544 stop:801 length:258 start_codon:yes stop_codon:yes gene_type:complete
MRLGCPICGERDRREFYYQGAALVRPEGEVWSPEWDDYIHNRDNPAGVTRDLWQHEQGCGAWLIVTRDTVSHAVLGVALAAELGA